jgi:hypothetical protein
LRVTSGSPVTLPRMAAYRVAKRDEMTLGQTTNPLGRIPSKNRKLISNHHV